jgi:hypothetical protein
LLHHRVKRPRGFADGVKAATDHPLNDSLHAGADSHDQSLRAISHALEGVADALVDSNTHLVHQGSRITQELGGAQEAEELALELLPVVIVDAVVQHVLSHKTLRND